MGRGRGKGKRQTFVATNEDQGSGEDQKNPAHRRRGRPQKPLKNGVVEDEKEVLEKIEANNGDESKGNVVNEDLITDAETTNNGRKRSRSTQAGENINSLDEENGGNSKTNIDRTIISVGFRQIGSRRKNKPRRAAEVGVECN